MSFFTKILGRNIVEHWYDVDTTGSMYQLQMSSEGRHRYRKKSGTYYDSKSMGYKTVKGEEEWIYGIPPDRVSRR